MYGDIKFALIYGDNPVDGNNYSGIIETVRIDDEATHIEYMINFFQNHFKEDKYLQDNIYNWTANQVGLYLKELGHIFFMNITSYENNGPKNSKREGVFMMPDEPTEMQLKALEKFKSDIADYYTIQIWRNFYVDELGCLSCTNMTNENYELSSTELLDIFIKQNQKTK